MPRWTTSGRGLLRDGVPDFLLADTQWASLHRAEPERFEALLDLRAAQHFTGIMMSILPIAHDRSGNLFHPFETDSDGVPDFARLDEGWLDRAEQMVAAVAQRGLVPVLMLVWVDYVPGTWASLAAPELAMDEAQTLALVDAVVTRLRGYQPIWSVSGDDTFTSGDAIARYRAIARRVRELDPDALLTAHTGGWINLPPAVAELIDLVGYQSGHDGANWRDNPQQWNRYLAACAPGMPSANLEPPYEGHGYSGGRGRYTDREVRLASWRSVLTGAGAGLGYGAHGVWPWHHAGDEFSSEGWSGMPFDVEVAAQFPGASQLAWLRDTAIDLEFWTLVDRADLVVRDASGIVVGATPDLSRLVIHAPEAFAFEVQVLARDYTVSAYDIVAAEPVEARTHPGESGMLNIAQPTRFTEHLYVLERC